MVGCKNIQNDWRETARESNFQRVHCFCWAEWPLKHYKNWFVWFGLILKNNVHAASDCKASLTVSSGVVMESGWVCSSLCTLHGLYRELIQRGSCWAANFWNSNTSSIWRLLNFKLKTLHYQVVFIAAHYGASSAAPLMEPLSTSALASAQTRLDVQRHKHLPSLARLLAHYYACGACLDPFSR